MTVVKFLEVVASLRFRVGFFSPNLKPFASVSLWFHFCCHFDPKAKSAQISKKKPGFLSFSKGHFGHFAYLPNYPPHRHPHPHPFSPSAFIFFPHFFR
ncbi:hypothetical protein Hanom_Chr04g00306701 [Helianthus anomalus]